MLGGWLRRLFGAPLPSPEPEPDPEPGAPVASARCDPAPLPAQDETQEPFDEQWYLATYPDVAARVKSGGFTDGYAHYMLHGRAEGRRGWPAEAPPCEKVRIEFGAGGNSPAFVRNGWSGEEAQSRWAVGPESALVLPALNRRPSLLMLRANPYCRTDGSLVQTLAIAVNDVVVDRFALHRWVARYHVAIPAELISATGTNRITLLHPNAEQPTATGGTDARMLAICVWELSLEPSGATLFAAPERLPRAAFERRDHGALVSRFQSLGQNCEFGLLQRRCSVEPLGFLRFSWILLESLLLGIETGFAGIADPAKLTLVVPKPGAEILGLHEIYGLSYHTFKYDGQIDKDAFHRTEVRRLAYLANALIEQIDRAEKMFVFQRTSPPLELRDVLPLLHALRARNPDNILLWVTVAPGEEPDLAGCVERLGPGFFHGWIDRLAPIDDAHDLSFQRWIEICQAVDRAAAGGGQEDARLGQAVVAG